MKEAVKKRAERSHANKVDQLTRELKEKREEMDQQRKFSKTAAKNLQAIREFIDNPSKVINKAMLFDEKVMETGKQISANLMMALVSYHRKMEAILEPLREVMKEVEERREREQGLETEPELAPAPLPVTEEEVRRRTRWRTCQALPSSQSLKEK